MIRIAEDFITNLPPGEKQLVEALRSIVLSCSPAFVEKLSYGVPYYFLHRRVCFIWPASAGAAGIDEGVLLGFCYGNLLSNEQGLLEIDGRKQVYMITIRELSDIKPELFCEIIHEAILVDEGFRKK
ncbi:MAG: hypothetical protein FD123_2435 [Bacteroidetes bacterium]|nr:MAG: hypothetical protein FD123_2435 [Bacteroidota bacterium]